MYRYKFHNFFISPTGYRYEDAEFNVIPFTEQQTTLSQGYQTLLLGQKSLDFVTSLPSATVHK